MSGGGAGSNRTRLNDDVRRTGRGGLDIGASTGSGQWSGYGDNEGDVEGAGSGVLCCFVEARFRGQSKRTASVDSNLPTWNEQV